MRLKLATAALLASLMTFSSAPAATPFANWAAVVVAGDWHAHSGAPSEVFDNARRGIAEDLVHMGFSPGNVIQFSVRPELYPDVEPRRSDGQTIATTLWDLSNRTDGGCLAYFTSHGSPEGIVMGDDTLAPARMNQMITNACGDRPTVVIVSACFSGVFVSVLAAPNRMILTAASADRTSFGCGQQDQYTFYDICMRQDLPGSGDFPDLARNVVGCVAAREKKEGIKYPSEPQVSIGADVAALLPRWR